MVKSEILKVKGSWAEVLDDCRATVKKEMTGKTPSPVWVQRILLSEHDPIRDIEVKFLFRGIPYWVAMHLKTHIWRSRTNSQRNDRQAEYDRNRAPQDAPVDFIGDCNAQHLIDTSRKRLCFQASPETRKAWESLKVEMYRHDDLAEIAEVMVPNCVYRCGCPEMQSCGWFDAMVKKDPNFASSNIRLRYNLYSREFYQSHQDECV